MKPCKKTKTDNSLIQKEKEVIKNSFLQLPSSISSPDNFTKQSCLTSQNKPTINIQPNSQPLTKNHNTTHANCASILSDRKSVV